MAKQPENAVLAILQQIQATLAEHGRDLTSIKEQLRRQGVKIDELFETTAMAFGMAGHANVRHDSVQKQLDELRERVERLEKQG